MPRSLRRAGLTLASAAALALAGVQPAAADDADRRYAALLLLEATASDAFIHRLAASPVRQLLRATHAIRPDLTPQEMMVLSALYHEEMHRAALGALRGRAQDLATRYSLRELDALRAYDATEDGRAALAEDSTLTGGLDRLIEAAMLARMDDAFDRHGRRD